MRPQSLFPLFAKIDRLPGIGPRTLALIAKVAGERPLDLLWHRPTGLIDRRATGSTAAAEPGQIATLVVEVVEHRPGGGARAPYIIECRDDGGEIGDLDDWRHVGIHRSSPPCAAWAVSAACIWARSVQRWHADRWPG